MKKKLLLIEDEPLIALTEQRRLEKIGYHVVHLASGEAAVIYTDKHRHEIDLILMDIDLGEGIDGTVAAQQILSRHRIPVVFLSSHTDRETVEKTEKITSYGYVVKNSGIVVLDASIKMALRLFDERTKRIEKEKELEQVLEATSDGIWSWDFADNIISFSDSYYRMLGYEPGEFEASFDNWAALLHPDDRPHALATADEYLKNKPDLYRNRFRLRKKDGSYLPVLCTAKVVKRDGVGNAVKMIGNHIDVTRNRLIEMELQQQKDSYYQLFNEHSAVKLLIDPQNGRIVNANKAAVAYYRYPKDDLLKMYIQQINCLSDEEVDTEMKRAEQQNKVYFEFRHRLADGTVRDVNVFSNNIIHNGRPCLHSIIFDVTETKRMQDRYRWLTEYDASQSMHVGKTYRPAYGDVTQFNSCREILDNIDRDNLQAMAEDVMALVDTSIAVYEKNGDYAFGMFNSGWCQLLDDASFKLCNTGNTAEALSCGKWHCHEDCWNNSAKPALETGQPTDIECVGGIRLYGAPIIAGNRIIGAVNIGYGDPPESEEKLHELADKFSLDAELLWKESGRYNARPPYIIELAKRRCDHLAVMIGREVELHQKSAALLASRHDYAQLLTNLNIGYLKVNKAGIIDSVNPVMVQMSGCQDANQLTGKPVQLLYADPEFRTAMLAQLSRSDRLENYELVLQTKNGTLIYTTNNIKVNRNNDGDIESTEALVRNVNDKKKLEQKIVQQKNLLNSVVDVLPGSLNVVDPHFNLLLSNKEKFLRFKLEHQDALGQKCYSAFHNRATPCPWCHLQEVLESGEEYSEITDMSDPRSRKTGIIWKVSIKPLRGTQGELIGAIEYAVDVTDLKNAEKEALHRLDEKTLFIREAHHRIMNNISTIANLLQVQIDAETEPAVTNALKTVLSRINSMHLLYHKLLLTDDYRSLPAGQYFEELLATLRSLHASTPVRVVREIDNFELDSKQLVSLGMVLNEFVTNSMKYAFTNNDRGELTVRLKKRDNTVELYLKDDGPGFNTDTIHDDGSGMGLSLIQILAQQLQGELLCETDNGAMCRLLFRP